MEGIGVSCFCLLKFALIGKRFVMDEKLEKIVVLEQKIIDLLNKLKQNHFDLTKLNDENQDLLQQNNNYTEEVLHLKAENKSLKIANNLLGSNEGKASTKNKINSLIKEVDFCINQLTEINSVYE